MGLQRAFKVEIVSAQRDSTTMQNSINAMVINSILINKTVECDLKCKLCNSDG